MNSLFLCRKCNSQLNNLELTDMIEISMLIFHRTNFWQFIVTCLISGNIWKATAISKCGKGCPTGERKDTKNSSFQVNRDGGYVAL